MQENKIGARKTFYKGELHLLRVKHAAVRAALAVGNIIPSFIPDTSSRTGTTLWLIKGIEPLKCARFSEEERVIKRQADREDGLQTYPSKTSQQSFVVYTLY